MHSSCVFVQLWIEHNFPQILTWVSLEKPKPSIVSNKPPATLPLFFCLNYKKSKFFFNKKKYSEKKIMLAQQVHN